MPRLLAVLALVATTPLLAACGGAASSPSTNAPAPASATIPASAASLVLHLPDLEAGYAAVSKYTRPITLAMELKGDSPSARTADRAGYHDGYGAFYTDAQSDVVMSEALTYKDESSASTVYSDTSGLDKLEAELHAHTATPPAGSPGTGAIFVEGRVSLRGAWAPAYVLAWRHGTVLNVVALWGINASTTHLVSLANRQDTHITAAQS